MVEGGAALGIYRGFTGLVTKPVEGAKSKGVGSAVQSTAACLHAYELLLRAFYVQKPWPKGSFACHLLLQQLCRPAGVQH